MADHSNNTAECPAPSGHSEPLTCAFDLKTLVSVRAKVKEYAHAAGLQNLRLYKFVVAVNEVMTNAVHHGGGAGKLRLWHDDGCLHCDVTDHGPGLPRNRVAAHQRPEPGTIGGWGLWLTREICDRVVIQPGATGGTRVILQYPLA